MNVPDRVFEDRIDDPKIVQHRLRAGEVEAAILIEQTASYNIHIDLATKLIESCSVV